MTKSEPQVFISKDQSYLTLKTGSLKSRFHGNWLRDNALDEQTRSPGNGQKLVSVMSLPELSLIENAQFDNGTDLIVQFVNNPAAYFFPIKWLEKHQYDRTPTKLRGWVSKNLRLWRHGLDTTELTATYSSLQQSNTSLCAWLAQIERYGFALLDDIPPEADGLLDVVKLFGYVRETNYGKTFEVRSEINPSNLAYTGLGLQAHTDNPYRDPAPTMQILACMENSAEGGESMVVDGFHAASQLREESETHFDLLSRYPARFGYSGSTNVMLESKRPMIELGVDGELISVRFNNRSAAPFSDIPFETMQDYYQAYRHFAKIISRENAKVTFKLHPRQLFIVDNTRVLHSRTAFSGTGTRWLRGCYPDKDGMLSTLNALRRNQNETT